MLHKTVACAMLKGANSVGESLRETNIKVIKTPQDILKDKNG